MKEEGSNWPLPPEKATLKKPSLIRAKEKSKFKESHYMNLKAYSQFSSWNENFVNVSEKLL